MLARFHSQRALADKENVYAEVLLLDKHYILYKSRRIERNPRALSLPSPDLQKNPSIVETASRASGLRPELLVAAGDG